MSSEKYIGGAFARDDSKSFRLPSSQNPSFFHSQLRVTGFETGADALAWLILKELEINELQVFFPLHYCEDTIQRIELKTNCTVLRYKDRQAISSQKSIVIWNHFNGYQPLPEWLSTSEHIIFEDGVQSLLALNKQVGKASFTSLRKWLELDLAVVFSPYSSEEIIVEPSTYFTLKKDGERLKRKWKDGILKEESYLDTFAAAEKSLYTPTISFQSTDELNQYNWEAIYEKRRENSQILIDFLQSEKIQLIGSSELFIMIQIKNRDKVRSYLAQRGIFAPIHWLDSADNELAQNLLSLPIDQRYDAEDMQHIVNTLADAIQFTNL